MAVEIDNKIKEAVNSPDSVKVLASVDRHGRIHSVPKGSIFITDDGKIRYYELLESSQTNKNVTYALWFNKEISITVVTKDHVGYQIKGVPKQSLVLGHEYEEHYSKILEGDNENDLAAVYFIEPTEIIEQTYPIRRKEEKEKHPLYVHLDRLAKE